MSQSPHPPILPMCRLSCEVFVLNITKTSTGGLYDISFWFIACNCFVARPPSLCLGRFNFSRSVLTYYMLILLVFRRWMFYRCINDGGVCSSRAINARKYVVFAHPVCFDGVIFKFPSNMWCEAVNYHMASHALSKLLNFLNYPPPNRLGTIWYSVVTIQTQFVYRPNLKRKTWVSRF